ncbi:MAG: hypothetical protein IPK96_04840 [Flammeovirgaceae bacterium]|nr:hypothetical protein [Flammeovirgaceae bacterium]
MKTKFTFLSILSVVVVFGATAQGVEYDDIYFRSKDRVVFSRIKTNTGASISKGYRGGFYY